MRLRCDGLCPCYNDFQISQRPTPFRAATIVLLNCFLAASHRRCLVTRYSTLPPSTSSISCPFNQTNTVSSESASVGATSTMLQSSAVIARYLLGLGIGGLLSVFYFIAIARTNTLSKRKQSRTPQRAAHDYQPVK